MIKNTEDLGFSSSPIEMPVNKIWRDTRNLHGGAWSIFNIYSKRGTSIHYSTYKSKVLNVLMHQPVFVPKRYFSMFINQKSHHQPVQKKKESPSKRSRKSSMHHKTQLLYKKMINKFICNSNHNSYNGRRSYSCKCFNKVNNFLYNYSVSKLCFCID
jgi:hypothetical protein